MLHYCEHTEDCKGSGYDIAEQAHIDNKARVELRVDRVIRREPIYLGDRRDEVVCGYQTTEISFDDKTRQYLQDNPTVTVEVQIISEALGAWRHANKRARIRVALVDTSKHHRRVTERGYLQTLSESSSVCLDYTGGDYGYGESLADAEKLTNAVNCLIDAARNSDIAVAA